MYQKTLYLHAGLNGLIGPRSSKICFQWIMLLTEMSSTQITNLFPVVLMDLHFLGCNGVRKILCL